MSLRDVMAFIQNHQQAVQAVATESAAASASGAAPTNDCMGQPVKAPNPPSAASLDAPDHPDANGVPAQALPNWRTLDRAYLAHHAHCHVCQAAGRGACYSLRCGVGASLWCTYTETVMLPGALPWQKQNRFHHNGRSA